MTDPDWLQKYKEENPNGGPRGWLPGQSGNPNGRPKGSKNRKTVVVQEFEKEGSRIARVVIDAALEGDMTAANMVLQRLSPPLRSRSEKVTFELDADKPLSAQAQQILSAVATGDIDPDTGKLLIDAIGAFAGIKQVDDLEARLAALEGRR
ncbi:hypothetical protein KZO25_06785 [Halomonas sp. ANAO-440]|uniref:DUF5681 domain-containing protein n=1 Tax=Halomonas sp. ANAO-440 TaxID=2861360 RepID=UPI001CAA64D9|nr:DUF5681 domain-containing protein [Halomonas sp. ANAO-440]MBZ0330024.1 hypothetical protein [Halomonas sp. ANAO-440]